MEAVDMTTNAGRETMLLLERFRRAAVVRLVVYGICAVCWGGCFSLLTVVLLDWIFDLPASVRIFGACMFVLGFGLAVLYWIVRPLQRNVSIQHVARRIERRFPELVDRLTSLVYFVDASADDGMTCRVVGETERAVAALPVERVFTMRPMFRQAFILLTGLSAVGLVSQFAPNWLQTGVRRYVTPYAANEWPRVVQIESLSHEVMVASGDTVVLEMRVTEGKEEDLRGLVHLVDASGKESVRAMHRDAEFRYRCSIDHVKENGAFWFSAGDNSTRKNPGTIVVVDRPRVVRATATVSAPTYAEGSRAVDFDLQNSPVRAVAGSLIEITIETSKPIRPGDDGQPDARIQNVEGELVPLKFSDDRRGVVIATLNARESDVYSVHLTDNEGFENRPPWSFRTIVEDDQPPSIELVRPGRNLEVTASARIPFELFVQDDFAVKDVYLSAAINDGETSVVSNSWMPMADHVDEQGADRLHILTDYSLDELDLSDGDRLSLEVRATDNYELEDTNGQTTSSRPVRVKIVSRRQFETRLQESLVAVRKRLRSVMEAQQQIRSELSESRDDPAGRGWGLDQQLRLNRRAEALVKQVSHVDASAAMAAGDATESVRVVSEMVEPLRDVVENRMQPVAELLSGGDAEDVSVAIELQAEAVDELRRVLTRMQQWTDVQSVLANVRDLLDRQQAARRELEKLGNETTGKKLDELDEQARRSIGAISRLQADLAQDVEGVLNRLRGDEIQQDREGAVGDAFRLAVAGELYERMVSAADAVGENRLAAARLDQRAAEETLLEMIAAIRRQQSRQLAKLSKKLEENEAVVARLLAQQAELITTTEEAFALGADANVFNRLADEQRLLGRNTEHVSDGLNEAIETAEVASVLMDAADVMLSAANGLKSGEDDNTKNDQDTSKASLEYSLELIQRAKRAAEHEAFQRMMAAIGEQLGELADRQMGVNERTGVVRQIIADAGQMTRKAAREIRKATKEQAAIRESTKQIRDSLTRSVVFTRVLDDASGEMEQCETWLKQRRIDDLLVEKQSDIVRRLDQLVRALADIQKLPPSDEFVSGAGGGGGNEQASSDSPRVPPVAELMMIKTMQEDLLTTTREMSIGESRRESATEAQLRAVEGLSKRQQSLMELTELVTKQSRGEP